MSWPLLFAVFIGVAAADAVLTRSRISLFVAVALCAFAAYAAGTLPIGV